MKFKEKLLKCIDTYIDEQRDILKSLSCQKGLATTHWTEDDYRIFITTLLNVQEATRIRKQITL